MNRFVLKLALIFLVISIVLAGLLFYAYSRWTRNLAAHMPEEGKAIFARINPEKCSLDLCEACTAEQCPESEERCGIREYRWEFEGKTYFKLYCDSAKP